MHTHDDSAAAAATDAAAAPSAREWWEARYAERDGIWSGRVNAVLASVTWGLPVGRALDLGCGEGGDVVWLAEQGWDVTGIDLSVTALERGSRAAVSAGVEDRTAFVAADLARWETTARFDLVTASFLQSWPVEIPRADILLRAAGFVRVGGHLLVTAHAAPPHDDLPPEMHGYRFPSPSEDLAALQLDDAWDVAVAEVRPRTASTSDGDPHQVLDSVVLVRRLR
ncbi:class I SAM-dependent methyltransferase [Curtobacterium sp. VKM Ac-1376]|uniref:class I SAM-dependent methyltransferase n=1 Tax=Curtobacterium sp. VKM Ac-1376 TaxID=123312 RepID=UPI00188B0AF8|nr:class I SAM-dependent methyltransferase [Curtobacterium sp. VKM Ac-1376]MBF4616140.1 class I SAM-dependent methyltransferase [Curtobacterium sp. VKM Ac-1376]